MSGTKTKLNCASVISNAFHKYVIYISQMLIIAANDSQSVSLITAFTISNANGDLLKLSMGKQQFFFSTEIRNVFMGFSALLTLMQQFSSGMDSFTYETPASNVIYRLDADLCFESIPDNFHSIMPLQWETFSLPFMGTVYCVIFFYITSDFLQIFVVSS